MKPMNSVSVFLVFSAAWLGCGGSQFSAADVQDSGTDSDTPGQDAAGDQKVGDPLPEAGNAEASADSGSSTGTDSGTSFEDSGSSGDANTCNGCWTGTKCLPAGPNGCACLNTALDNTQGGSGCWPCGGYEQLACPLDGWQNGYCTGGGVSPTPVPPAGACPSSPQQMADCRNGSAYNGQLPAPVQGGWYFCY